MPKHVARKECARRYSTVDGDKCLFSLRPVGMNRTSDQLFPCATWAKDEHIRDMLSNTSEIQTELLRPRRHTDNFVECDPPAIVSRLARHRNAFCRVPHLVLFEYVRTRTSKRCSVK